MKAALQEMEDLFKAKMAALPHKKRDLVKALTLDPEAACGETSGDELAAVRPFVQRFASCIPNSDEVLSAIAVALGEDAKPKGKPKGEPKGEG